ncbi:MAG: hypothetical protein KGS00_04470 [Alphaproteobacteria bacterium]|nr:hypothetical protein [Alphaproteobacteria bacterium]
MRAFDNGGSKAGLKMAGADLRILTSRPMGGFGSRPDMKAVAKVAAEIYNNR